MKKTALLAVALATCLAYVPAQAAEVVSSNIVGYQKVTLQPGFNFVAPQFTAVGGGDLDLQSIKLDIADDDATGSDNLQILDDGGATVATYVWFPAAWTTDGKSGWADENFALVDGTLANGLSVLIDSTDNLTVTVAGEVKDSDSVVSSVQGFNFVGNSSPVPIDIQDIRLGIADADATGSDNLQILDDGGATIATYVWFPADWTTDGKTGWADENFNLAEVELAPGQGVLIDCTEDDIDITIPSAL